jgi:predicted Zn-dependent peptidase
MEKDIEKERTIILDEIAGYEDDPEELIFEKADTLLYLGHPLENSILGYNDTVKSIGIEDLVEFRKNNYTPDKIIISIAGNIEHNQVVKKIEELFQLTNKKSLSQRVISEIPDYKSITEEKGFSQTHFILAKRLREIDIEDRYPISLVNVLLGDGMSSRLYQNIRERLGYTYSIYSSIQSHSDSGAIYIYGATDKENAKKSIDAVRKEVQKSKTNYFRKSEFKRAQEQLKSGLIMDLESMTSRMLNMGKKESLDRDYESITQMIENIDTLKFESIEEIVNFYFDENWVEVIFDQ